MNKVRKVIAYQNHFEDFLKKQPEKVQDKIFKVIEAIETLERVPSNYLKALSGTKGLYEARIKLGSDIWRVFCFFDEGRLVILLNGFMSPLRKPLFITNGCKIQYLRHRVKSFLNVAMATPAEYFSLFLDLELFTHFHVQKGFRSGLIYKKITKDT